MIYTIICLIVFCLAVLFSAIVIGLLIASYMDWKNPPTKEDLEKRWHTIYADYKGDWDRGRATLVYYYAKSGDIIGKVVKQEDGLYRATMYNGNYKEFIYEHEATKSVENYKPRIIK